MGDRQEITAFRAGIWADTITKSGEGLDHESSLDVLDSLRELDARLAEAEARNRRVYEAGRQLLPYASHTSGCDTAHSPNGVCSCGVSDVKAFFLAFAMVNKGEEER